MGWAETEQAAFVETLRATDPDAPTLCQGWRARHLLAHLVLREQDVAGTLGDVVVRRPPGQEKFLGRLADGARTPTGYQALVDRFLVGAPRWSPMSWASEQLNHVEYVIHHEDVRRGGGPAEPRVLSEQQQRALWSQLGLFARLEFRSCPVGVVLAWPGGAARRVHKGPENVTLSGGPVELALYVSGRREAASVQVSGTESSLGAYQRWLAGR